MEGMKDVIIEPPDHHHGTAVSFACENKKNDTSGSGVLRLLG